MSELAFDFDLGDRVLVSAKDHGIEGSQPYVVGSEPINAGTPNVMYYVGDIDVLQGSHVHLDDPKSAELLNISLEKAGVDALPTVPGKYEDVSVRNHNELISAILGEEYEPEVWTLNEDGTWTDVEGETHPATDNWILVVTGAEFELVS